MTLHQIEVHESIPGSKTTRQLPGFTVRALTIDTARELARRHLEAKGFVLLGLSSLVAGGFKAVVRGA